MFSRLGPAAVAARECESADAVRRRAKNMITNRQTPSGNRMIRDGDGDGKSDGDDTKTCEQIAANRYYADSVSLSLLCGA